MGVVIITKGNKFGEGKKQRAEGAIRSEYVVVGIESDGMTAGQSVDRHRIGERAEATPPTGIPQYPSCH